MRVKLFVSPAIYTKGPEARLILLPYGLGVLTSFLRRNDVSVDLQNLDAELRSPHSHFEQKKMLRRLLKYSCLQLQAGRYMGITDKRNDSLASSLLDLACMESYDLIGFGVNSEVQILTTLLLAEKIKKRYNIPIVIGGPYVTSFAHLFFEKYDFIDYAIVGEGEIPLLELVQYIQGKGTRRNVPSLWYKNNTQVVFNGRTFYNIEDQSCPDFEGLPFKLYQGYMQNGIKNTVIPYSTARGCPGRCTFCTYPQIDGPWQSKSTRKIVNDIIFLKKKYKSKFFSFRNSNFNMSYKHVNELCDELIKKEVDIQWSAFVKGSNLDKNLLVKMKKAGCHRLMWGIESGSNRLLRLMRKDIDVKECIKSLETAKKAGIDNTAYLMVGYPYESSQDLEQTALLLKNNARFIDNLSIFIFRVNYGSFVYNNQEALKIEIKETKISSLFYWYQYRYKETEECSLRHVRRKRMKSRNKVIGYGFRYIKHKHVRFPLNVAVKYIGLIFPKELFMIEQRMNARILG